MTKKNPQTPKEQYTAIIEHMDISQLENTSNNVSVVKELNDLPNQFVENSGDHYDQRDGEIVRSNPQFERYSEMSRFSFDLTKQAREIVKKE